MKYQLTSRAATCLLIIIILVMNYFYIDYQTGKYKIYLIILECILWFTLIVNIISISIIYYKRQKK
ncbi:hypothetical protein CPU09_14050 [Mammaliicoccus sciuri]|uniref:hypothetical protein n=1 Tax=Mammaliicoccus sciuri TaxID=1296 RepID=UPI000BBF0113|nr:hypothetical protein [Mammaliicoccus sciuri]PCM40001.1 hypothetical protein CPU09_14050 [Mammaliicoccus sciuri]